MTYSAVISILLFLVAGISFVAGFIILKLSDKLHEAEIKIESLHLQVKECHEDRLRSAKAFGDRYAELVTQDLLNAGITPSIVEKALTQEVYLERIPSTWVKPDTSKLACALYLEKYGEK